MNTDNLRLHHRLNSVTGTCCHTRRNRGFNQCSQDQIKRYTQISNMRNEYETSAAVLEATATGKSQFKSP
jgi:hypothetical protein